MDKSCRKKLGLLGLGGVVGLMAVFSAERESKKEEAERARIEKEQEENRKKEEAKKQEQKKSDIEFYKWAIMKCKKDIKRYEEKYQKDGDEFWLEMKADEEDTLDEYELELELLEK